jgi:hypothetical protein
LRGEARAPSYKAFDPVALPQLLANLMVTEVVDSDTGRRYRYRLCGTEVETNFGCPMQGKYIDELMEGKYLAYIEQLYGRVVDNVSPVYSQSSYGDVNRGLQTKRLMLPMSTDGDRVDVVLSVQTFFRSSVLSEPIVIQQSSFEDGSGV